MARKPAAQPDKTGKGQSPNVVAAIAAATELTARTTLDAEAVANVATGLRELFSTYMETANPILQKHGLRITALEAQFEYGVNLQDPATMIERNEGAITHARDLANGVLRIGISNVEPQTLNISLFETAATSSDGAHLIIMIGNRAGDANDVQSDPYLFMLPIEEKKPKSFLPVHEAKGERMSVISRAENPLGVLDFVSKTIQDMMVNKRRLDVAQQRPAA